MKKLVIFGAVALLAACGSKQEPAADASATPDAMASAPAMGDASAPAADASGAAMAPAAVKPGVYDYASPGGKKGVMSIMADGMYVDRDDAGKVLDKGKVAAKDGKTCFSPEKGDERCYTDGTPAADGSFDATGADGKVTHVMPHKKK